MTRDVTSRLHHVNDRRAHAGAGRTSLLGFLIGFSLWQGARLAQQVSPADGPPAAVFTAVQLTGWLIWAVFLIQVVIFGRGAPAAIRGALNDELTTHRREMSWAIGFFAVMFTQGVLLFAAVTNPGIRLAAEFTVFVGVLAAIGSYLYLDRE